MSNTAVKVASVVLVVLASTTASFARGAGNFGGVRPNAGIIGTVQSQVMDPSGIANAVKTPANKKIVNHPRNVTQNFSPRNNAYNRYAQTITETTSPKKSAPLI